jgi:hypothetical protein
MALHADFVAPGPSGRRSVAGRRHGPALPPTGRAARAMGGVDGLGDEGRR